MSRILHWARPVLTLSMCLIAVAAVADSSTNAYTDERVWFMAAHKALDENEPDEFEKHRAKLGEYPIAHYLDYLHLRKRFAAVSPGKKLAGELNRFERESGSEVLTRRLTQQLQSRAAEEKQWPFFKALSQSRLAADMPCSHLMADADAGQLSNLNEAAIALWVEPAKRSEGCMALLDKLESKKTPPIKAIWQRIYAAVDNGKPEHAESVLHYLGRSDKQPVQDWIKAREKPKQYLLSGALKEDNAFNRRALVDLTLLWSKTSPVDAMNFWLANYQKYRFYNDRYYDTHRLLAMRGAYRRLPEAYEWLNSLEGRDDDLELKEWRIRAALYEQDWKNVLRSLKRLPLEEQKEDHWAYWEARALEEAGHAELANSLYTTLSELPTYHGFLAADKVDADYAIKNQPIVANPDLLAALEQQPGLIRAREYHAVDIPWEGRREWNDHFKDADTDTLAAMAVLAERWQLYDRAIQSAGRAEKKRALTTRFPIVYEDEVEAAASKNQIPVAWVYGVMRRESGYMRDVKSSAGAVGLMQLMPNTAKFVAKLQGDKNWRGDLTDVETNIGFGTFYLRHVMDKFDDHQVLATASYNAGPRRVSIWLPPEEMSADVWIDAIPYTETRRYVRAVLAYTTIYEWHLTKNPIRLSEKLAVIPAAEGT